MEENKKDMLSKCNMCRGHGRSIFRFVVTLFVIMIAFWCGLRLGELRGYIASMNSRENIRFYVHDYSRMDLPKAPMKSVEIDD